MEIEAGGEELIFEFGFLNEFVFVEFVVFKFKILVIHENVAEIH